jgi:hypothetical protein
VRHAPAVNRDPPLGRGQLVGTERRSQAGTLDPRFPNWSAVARQEIGDDGATDSPAHNHNMLGHTTASFLNSMGFTRDEAVVPLLWESSNKSNM